MWGRVSSGRPSRTVGWHQDPPEGVAHVCECSEKQMDGHLPWRTRGGVETQTEGRCDSLGSRTTRQAGGRAPSRTQKGWAGSGGGEG